MAELTRNFDAEFGTGRHNNGNFPNKTERIHAFGGGSDEEESSCDSSCNQVRTHSSGSLNNTII